MGSNPDVLQLVNGWICGTCTQWTTTLSWKGTNYWYTWATQMNLNALMLKWKTLDLVGYSYNDDILEKAKL